MNEGYFLIVVLALVAVAVAAWFLGRHHKTPQQTQADDSADRFKALSAEALAANNQAFVALAEQTIKRLYSEAGQTLDNKEQAIKKLVEPLQQALEESRRQTGEIERQRHQSFGEINKQLEHVRQAGDLIGGERD